MYDIVELQYYYNCVMCVAQNINESIRCQAYHEVVTLVGGISLLDRDSTNACTSLWICGIPSSQFTANL